MKINTACGADRRRRRKIFKNCQFFVYFQRKYGIDIHVLIPAGKSKNFQLIFTKFSFSVMPMGGEVSPSPPLPYATDSNEMNTSNFDTTLVRYRYFATIFTFLFSLFSS